LSGRTKVRSVSPNSTAGILAKQRILGLGRDALAFMRYLRGALRGWVALDKVAAAPAPNHLEFTCGLPLISAAVNGASVASVSDAMPAAMPGYARATCRTTTSRHPTLFINLLMTRD